MAKYTFNDSSFSEEELLEIAESKGYTLEELFEKNPGIKQTDTEVKIEETETSDIVKETPSQETESAAVEESVALEPTVTESVSEDISSGLAGKVPYNINGKEVTEKQYNDYLANIDKVGSSLDLESLSDPKKRKELEFTYGEEQKYLRNKTIPARIIDQVEPPSILKSLISKTARGFVSTGKGFEDFNNMIALNIADLTTPNLSKEDKVEMKQFLDSGGLKSLAAGVFPMAGLLPSSNNYKKIMDGLSESVRKLDSEGVTEAISKGDYAQAAELAVGGALESLPSVLAAATGYGGIAMLGTTVAGNKFSEEFDANPDKALGTLALNAIGTGVTEATFELVTRGLLKKAGIIKNESGVDAAKKIIQEGVVNFAKRIGIDTGKEGFTEGLTEGINILNDSLILGKEFLPKEIFFQITDGAIIGSVMGGSIGSLSELGNSSDAIRNRAEYILSPVNVKQDYAAAADELSQLAFDLKNTESDEGKKLVLDQINKIEDNITIAKAEVSRGLNSLTKEELSEYASNQGQILEDQKTSYTDDPDSVKKLAKQRIEDLQQKNYDLFTVGAQRALETEIETISQVIKPEDINVVESVEDFKIQYPNIDPDADAFIEEDGKIVINKERAVLVGAVKAGSHELLHKILRSQLSNKEAAQTLIEDFKNTLTEKELRIVQKRIDDNYRYKKDAKGNIIGENALETYNEEYLTAFSDAVGKGEIKFQEDIFTKIGNFITNIIRPKGYEKLNFKEGKDVYNFIKDYQKNIAKGKVITKPEEGIKDVIKESRSEDASNKVQKLYEEKGADGAAFEIIEQFKPITNKIVDQRKNAPGFDRQLLTDEIETGAGGILDLIQAYDPASNVPLAAYINKYLPVRSITASRRILGEEFTDDITESVQVAAEAAPETEIEVAETKPAERLIEVKKQILSEPNQKELEDIVAEKLPELTPDQFTFKTLPNWAKQTLAKEINIPVKKFEGSSNFTQAELDKVTSFIENNIDTVRKALPDAAVLEGAPVSESLIGTATGVPNNLLKDTNLYTRLERGTKKAGLVPFQKNKGIDNTSIFKAIGIVDGKRTAGPRDKQAQTAKGLINVLAKFMTNQEVRKQADLTPRQKTDIETGKGSRLLFSKNISKEERKKRNKILINESTTAFKGNPSFNEYLKRIRPMLQNNKATKALSDTGNKSFKGNIYEYYIWERLNSLNINGLELMLPEYGTGTDIKATFFNQPFDLEVKLNLQDAFGAPTIYFDSGKNKWSFDESNLDQEIFDIVEKNIDQKKINNFLTEIQKLGAYSLNEAGNKKEKVDFTLRIPAESYKKNKNKLKTGKIDKLTASVYKKIAGKQLNKKEEQSLNNAIIEYYNKKGINYIVINDQMYYLKENPLRLPINQLTGDVYIKFRIKPGSLKKNKILGNFYNLMTVTQFGMDKATSEGTSLNKAFQTNLSKSISKAEVKNNKELPKKFQLPKDSTNEQVLAKMQELDDQANEERIKYSKSQNLDETFNNIIEAKTGIETYKRFSPAKATVRGASKGKFNFFIPPSAEDFVGLLYKTLGKGKVGDSQMQFYKDNLLDPYGRAMNDISSARVAMFEDYKTLKEDLKIIPKDLKKKGFDEYTREQAVRAYIWDQQGNKIPGLFKTDQQSLVDYVNNNVELKAFADQLVAIQKGDQYSSPNEGWLAGSITTDLLDSVNSIKRKKYLEQWQTNVDEVFSEVNMNKLEAAFGKPYREALTNILTRMKTGRNKPFTSDSLAGRFTNWLNNSVGAIMFFNTRSAALQLLSSVNFVNFTDNNPLKAGAAFANQPQYWKDFKFLFNSDFLKERRGGLRFNVSESEIADAAKKGGAKGVISKILQAGFLPTQMADSFAIATGGASFYRNRVKTYIKQGLTEAEATAKAFQDFRETAEESQQSSRPDRISAQQAGPLGRTILAFANTPAQYARLTKKAASDLINGRGDFKTNISKLAYYGFVQNLAFNFLQQAVFALAFGDESEEEEKKKQEKYIGVANGMADGFLRGIGISGAIISTLKNALIKIIKEDQKARPDYAETAIIQLLGISPPVQSKAQKLRSALKSYEWNKDEMKEKGFSLDNPAYLAGANVISASTNIPLDRVVKKVDNIRSSTRDDITTLNRMMLLAGWSDWQLDIQKEKPKKSKLKRKTIKSKTIKSKTIKSKTIN